MLLSATKFTELFCMKSRSENWNQKTPRKLKPEKMQDQKAGIHNISVHGEICKIYGVFF